MEEEKEGSTLQIGWACKRGDYCYSPICHYSKPAREHKRKEALDVL